MRPGGAPAPLPSLSVPLHMHTVDNIVIYGVHMEGTGEARYGRTPVRMPRRAGTAPSAGALDTMLKLSGLFGLLRPHAE